MSMAVAKEALDNAVEALDNQYIPTPEVKELSELETKIKNQIERRELLYGYAKSSMRNGVDYFIIDGKKSLGKAGAEKICSLFGVEIGEPEVHLGTMAALPEAQVKAGAIVYMITLYSPSKERIGSGLGARKITQDGGDINKTVKMAKKSALIDAVLSTFGLSDLFSQDLEENAPGTPQKPSKNVIDGTYVDKVLKSTKGITPGGVEWQAVQTKLGKMMNKSGVEMSAENTYSFEVKGGHIVSATSPTKKAQEKLNKLTQAS